MIHIIIFYITYILYVEAPSWWTRKANKKTETIDLPVWNEAGRTQPGKISDNTKQYLKAREGIEFSKAQKVPKIINLSDLDVSSQFPFKAGNFRDSPLQKELNRIQQINAKIVLLEKDILNKQLSLDNFPELNRVYHHSSDIQQLQSASAEGYQARTQNAINEAKNQINQLKGEKETLQKKHQEEIAEKNRLPVYVKTKAEKH